MKKTMQARAMATGFYEIPPKLIEELDLYGLEFERFQRGEITKEAFKAFRVPRGIYSQRGGETYMMRIKVPAGGLAPVQMEIVADLSERYGDGTPHVTNRQDVQIHGVRIEDTLAVLKALSQVNLTTRGGGGNTIRNITACAEAGICRHEAFDVSPYAVALTERFMMDPRSGALPRKFKIAFSGCPHDCALATINDLGFIARARVVGNRAERGFAVWAAGGMGAHSRAAHCLEELIPEEEVYNVAEAVLRIFDRLGDRDNRSRARLRFVAERVGQEGFRRIYREELRRVRKEERMPLTLGELPGGRPQGLIDSEATGREEASEDGGDPAYGTWLRTSVRPQRQAEYHSVEIRLPLGSLSAEKLRGLAGIVSRCGEGTVRTTHRQNILLRWLRQKELKSLFQALREVGLAMPAARGVSDVLSCPGAATCNLGICHSRGVAVEITRALEDDDLPLEELPDVDIRVSGCPNACGQHPIGAIGLHGLARRVGGRPVPHYRVLLGGQVEEGKTTLGRVAGVVPARRVPQLIHTFLDHYLSKRQEGENLQSFVERRGLRDMEEFAGERAAVPPHGEAPEFYVDCGTSEPFSLAGIGPGECAAGVRDLIEADIEDAGRYLYRARRSLRQGHTGDPATDLHQALSLAARALLVTRGAQPETDADVFGLFREQFVETRLVPDRYLDIVETARETLAGDFAGEEALDYAAALIDRVRELYHSMDASLQFRATDEAAPVDVEQEPVADLIDEEMDLRGVSCPFNYVQAKLRMEAMAGGQVLRLLLDEGEPIQNVPGSLEQDGQEVREIRQVDEHYEVIVRKREPPPESA